MNPFQKLDDAAIEAGLMRLAKAERENNIEIILHLMVVWERRLFAPAGVDSLFTYCTRVLGFSASTAHRRCVVAKKGTEYPQLIERLRDGRLQLCAAATVAGELTPETADDLLKAIEGLSSREVEAYLVKKWHPKQEAPTLILERQAFVFPEAAPPAAKAPRTVVRPLSETTNRMSTTVTDDSVEKLRRLRELCPGKTDDEIMAKAFDLLLEKVDPVRRHARRTKKAAKPTKKVAPRRPSVAVRDATLAESRGCEFVSRGGIRCGARAGLQFDHVRPYALGGKATRENGRALCPAHNQHFARLSFSAGSPVAPPRP
jgi:hypothetical protein